jgi:hypothetical protein
MIESHPLVTFADRWQIDGDWIRCRRCKRPQQVSRALHDFSHMAGCSNEGAEAQPWKSLAGLIQAQIAHAKPVTATQKLSHGVGSRSRVKSNGSSRELQSREDNHQRLT